VVELLHPDVYTFERGGTPTIQAASTSTFGMVFTSRRGPTDELGFVTSFRDWQRLYGTNYPDSFGEDAAYLFFQNGGRRMYGARVVGTGALQAEVDLPAIGTGATAAQIDGTGVAPFNLEPADAISIEVDGGAPQTFTFLATRAIRAGAGLAIVSLTGDTLILSIDGGPSQTITFGAGDTTAAAVAATINSQLTGGSAVVTGPEVDIRSDTRGTGSIVSITGGSALVEIGHTVGTTTGTGNVVNIDAVTIAEVVALLAGLVGATATSNSGALRITHLTAGLAFTLEVTAAPAVFGLPAGLVTGTNATPISIATVLAHNVGSWGNSVAVTTERWRAATTAILATGATTATLADVSKAEVGDVVKISDGTTTVIVHVNAVDVVNKQIDFKAIVIGAPIAVGALAHTASSHRVRTALSAAAVAADTKIKVSSAIHARVGTELSLDDGTNVIFRVVTQVNGSELTLNAAVGFTFAIGVPVTSHHFNLTVIVDNQTDRTHSNLSLEDTDETDWIELRLSGDSNESLNVTLVDLNPVISPDINDRPAPVVNLLLTGGNDGGVPTDNDYIGTTDPASGLQLIAALNAGDVNTVAIPGVTTQAVQQALSDFAEGKTNLIALVDPPSSMDQPVEVKDWRLNVHNRDTSYSALYYPWQEIRDRYASSRTAIKLAPPSGIMAGVYAQVDAESGVWTPPGNRLLREVIGPAVRVTDGQQDILDPLGINVIRTFPGEGTRPWGIRTLSNLRDGRHYVNVRRLLNFVKISVSASLRGFLFAPIQPTLFRTIRKSIESFYRDLWRKGGLYPNDDFGQAQFVKCDSENNTEDSRLRGELNVDSGINPPLAAEKILFTVGIFDGTADVTES
jgi:hypothetical protein